MNMTKERKIIFITGAILLTAAFIYRFNHVIQDIMVEQVKIDARKETLSRYLNISKRNRSLENEIDTLKQVINQSNSFFFNADKESLAAVDLKNILTESAEKNGINIRLIKDLPNENKSYENELMNEYQPIQVQIVFSSNVNQLMKMLYDIETKEKILSIIEARFYMRYQGRSPLIECRLSVKGFIEKFQSPN